jgi:hypothetical protein
MRYPSKDGTTEQKIMRTMTVIAIPECPFHHLTPVIWLEGRKAFVCDRVSAMAFPSRTVCKTDNLLRQSREIMFGLTL